MQPYVIVLALILASCQAFTIDKDVDIEVPLEYNVEGKEGRLVKLLEKLKDYLKNGNEKLGLPVLDPLKKDHLDLNLNKKGMIELQGTLDNIRGFGLSNYEVLKGDLTLVGLLANVSLSWNEIDLVTNYHVEHGKLADTLSFYGEGLIQAVIRGLEISVDMKIGASDGKLYVKELLLHVHLKKLMLRITGLFNDEDTSKLVSQIISETAPGIIEDYQNQLSKAAGPIVIKVLNKFLQNVSLSDILG